MREFEKNSKKTDQAEIAKLKKSIELLGDISGIVHDIETDEIICGNQRSKIIDINNCQIEIIKQYKKPDRFGTLIYGVVWWEGNGYTYRKVQWNSRQRQMANISSNLSFSNYDYFELAKNFAKEVVKASGFTKHEFDLIYAVENWDIQKKQKVSTPNSVICRFGDNVDRLDYDQYCKWEENVMFENNYSSVDIINAIKNRIKL